MSTRYQGVNMYPCHLCGKIFSRMYNLKRHINEIHTASHDVVTRGWITSLTLPAYSGLAPPLSHGGVTPTPPQHDGITYHHSGVTPPPHGGFTLPLPPPPPPYDKIITPPPPYDGVNHSMYGVSVTRGPFVFQYPMTMNVCSPTCCGKTI